MRRLLPFVFAACSGGAAKPATVAPEPEPAKPDPGAILYVDTAVKGFRWVDLASEERGESSELAAAVVAGANADGSVVWLSGLHATRDNTIVLAKATRAASGLTVEVVDVRPAPVWTSKSIIQRTLTGARAVSPSGDLELLVCPVAPTRVCLRSLTDPEAGMAVVQYEFENPSYGAWTAAGPVVFDPGGTGVGVVAIDPSSGLVRGAGRVDGWSIPALSPDGTQMVWFDAEEPQALLARDLRDTEADARRIELDGARTLADCRFVDAEQVVCATGQDAPGYRLFAIDLGGGAARLLSDDLGQPMWTASPNGDEIAFARMTAPPEEDGLPRLAIVPLAGGEPRWVDPPGDTIQYPVAWVRRPD